MNRLVILPLIFLFSFTRAFSQKHSSDTIPQKRWEFGIGVSATLYSGLTNTEKTVEKSSYTAGPGILGFAKYNLTKNFGLEMGLSAYYWSQRVNFSEELLPITDTSTGQTTIPKVYYKTKSNFLKVSIPISFIYKFPISQKSEFFIKAYGDYSIIQNLGTTVETSENGQISNYKISGTGVPNLDPFSKNSDDSFTCGLFIGNNFEIPNKAHISYEIGIKKSARKTSFSVPVFSGSKFKTNGLLLELCVFYTFD
jgi:hypothetical protein